MNKSNYETGKYLIYYLFDKFDILLVLFIVITAILAVVLVRETYYVSCIVSLTCIFLIIC